VVPLVNIKIAGKWMFIPLKMVLIGFDPYPNHRKSPLFMIIPSRPVGVPPGPRRGRGGRINGGHAGDGFHVLRAIKISWEYDLKKDDAWRYSGNMDVLWMIYG
jgi:hypothetical protein